MKPTPAGSATTTSTGSTWLARGARDHWFHAAGVIAFAGGTAATIASCAAMSGGMDMPGGWTMSMAWMRMPGQGWPAAGGMFLQMWLCMMVAMMTPSLVLMLASHRRALRRCDDPNVGTSTGIAALAYFAVWQAVGALIWPLGVLVNAATMQWASVSRMIPALAGAALVLCGIVQLSPWKMRALGRCRDPESCGAAPLPAGAGGACRRGVELGLCCASCCTGFMLALLVLGTMDLGVMAVITVAITLERVLPRPRVAVRLSGAAMVVLGVIGIGRLLVR
jgi:predicted metal-binding membrane protein